MLFTNFEVIYSDVASHAQVSQIEKKSFINHASFTLPTLGY